MAPGDVLTPALISSSSEYVSVEIGYYVCRYYGVRRMTLDSFRNNNIMYMCPKNDVCPFKNNESQFGLRWRVIGTLLDFIS